MRSSLLNRRVGARNRVRTLTEALESRTLLNAGGGFTGAGILGSYYEGTSLDNNGTVAPSFTRTDVRVDFNFGTTGTPGGSDSPGFNAIGTADWSARWVGLVIPKYSETYTFTTTITANDGVRLYLAPPGSSNYTMVINDWISPTQAVETYVYAMTAGQSYNIELEYYQTTGAAEIKLHWSCPSAPDEAIEPATEVGLNMENGDAVFANLVNGGTRNYWYGPGNNFSTIIPMDSDSWPQADAELFLGEGDTSVNSGGTWLIQFQGTATVTNWPQSAQFYVGTHNYGSSLPVGDGYNSGTGLTTATMSFGAGSYNGFYLTFSNSSRDGNVTSPEHDGITNLYVMQPTTLGGSTDYPVGTVFTSAAISMASQYNTLRLMDFGDTNGNLTSNWSDRTLPSENFWSGWTFKGGSGVDTGDSSTEGSGVPWELGIALANITGKDIYINIPSNVSVTYIDDLANLFAFGSDGVTPYTSPTANPVWAPLDSNLKIYIEYSNEIWNSGFSQSGTAANGWINQLSQRAVYDFEEGITSDSLYPGGGANAYNDGAIVAPLYINSGNKTTWLATYNASGAVNGNNQSPSWFSNGDSSLTGYTIYQGWAALRLEQISTAFKNAFGETGISANTATSRVRPVFEWQYGGSWAGELSEMQALFGSQHPDGYYLYGGGGGWYYSDTDNGFSDAVFANGNFGAPVVSTYTQNPSGASWTFNGAAGIAANGSGLGNPTAPTLGPPNNPAGSGQTAYLQPGASIRESVDFSGGYADITLLATQTVANDNVHGLTVSIDGGPALSEEEGAAEFSGSKNAWEWDRTAAFNVSAGYHIVIFTNTWTTTGDTVFVDNVGIQTVNDLFTERAAGSPPGLNSVKNDALLCLQYGLFDVGYEGGFNWSQNLGYDDIGGYGDMGDKGYSSSTPNVGEAASLDPRTVPIAETTINLFYAYGGTLPIVYQAFGNINSWGVAAPSNFNWDTPKQQAAAGVEQALPASPATAIWNGNTLTAVAGESITITGTSVSTASVSVNGGTAYTIYLSNLGSIYINGAAGNVSLTLNFTNDSPVPNGGLTFTGGMGDSLVITGTAGADTAGIGGDQLTFNFSIISFPNVSTITLNTGAGNDILSQTSQPTATFVTFNGGTGGDQLNVSSGTYTFSADPEPLTSSLSVAAIASGAQVLFGPGSTQLIHLAGLTLSGGATATVVSLGIFRTATNTRALVIGTAGQTSAPPFSIDALSTLNLANNNLIIHGGNLTSTSALLETGYNASNGGDWNGKEIVSTNAAGGTLTTLGAIQPTAATTVDTESVGTSDVVVEYTYYGDANLDGKVDGSDYSRIDYGYLTHLTGWANGDFNYDGVINGSDYTLIDNAFNMQAAPLGEVAAVAANIHDTGQIPYSAGSDFLNLSSELSLRSGSPQLDVIMSNYPAEDEVAMRQRRIRGRLSQMELLLG